MELNQRIAVNLLAARKLRNRNGAETQAEAAEACGIKQTTLSAIENGRSQTPENLLKLATHYGVSLDWLFGRRKP